MNFTVARKWFTSYSTVSEVFLDGDGRVCYGLEPVTLAADSETKPRAIPCATYTLDWIYSPKHCMYVPLVKDVPGFSMVEWHIGNWGTEHYNREGKLVPSDTEACLLVGATFDTASPDFVGHSSLAFEKVCVEVIKPAILRGETVTATYEDAR